MCSLMSVYSKHARTMNELLIVIFGAWAIAASYLHLRADEQRRDLLTDMAQQIHDGRVKRKHLRRSRGIDEIEDSLDRWN